MKPPKLSVKELYSALDKLTQTYGWQENQFYASKPEIWRGKRISYPVKSFSSLIQGQALWIISGIHGEEPAGPNAIARNIDFLGELGTRIPIALFPLCNPLGYSKSWRYPSQRKWGENLPNISVTDSEHYLSSLTDPTKPRLKKPVSNQANALTDEILRLSRKYPIKVCLNLHEDNLINEGYIYSYGTNEELKKYLAKQLLRTLKKNQVKIKTKGRTRFNETIKNGVVQGTPDGSIDEFLSSRYLIINKKIRKGLLGQACFVIETPTVLPLEQRVNAYSAIIKLQI